jgi:hypothetical protein
MKTERALHGPFFCGGTRWVIVDRHRRRQRRRHHQYELENTVDLVLAIRAGDSQERAWIAGEARKVF